LNGLWRTEFMRRAALQEAQAAILDESVIRLSPDAFREFEKAIGARPSSPPPETAERLNRRPPWGG